MHLAISKGMKLYCTVEQALEDVIVVSLKHKTKEFRGILLDSSQRHLPPGLTFPKEGDLAPIDGATAGNSSADGPDQLLGRDLKGATLACRYSYNYDPAKYNEQPLPAHPSISIRSSRGKTVRNIRLRPRQTLCSKCKSMIHDNKSKSPSKVLKPEGEGQGETNYHNTRYRAAQSGKTPDANTSEPMLTRAGLRNRRLEVTNPKVMLENIRPKREVKSTGKRKSSPEADIGQKNSSRRGGQQQEDRGEDSVDSVSQSSRSGASRTDNDIPRSSEEISRVMMERSVSLENSSTLGQYNRQPVVRLEKSLVSTARVEERAEKTIERIPTLQIANIPRPSPAIKISYGDGAVLKIPPRLPGAELKSPESHSTAEESPVPNSPLRDPSPPAKKTKKASRKSRDKQRYRIVNDSEVSSEPQLPGIKIASHHRKHKRKHKHRHANTEDENFNLKSGLPPPSKFPAIIAKFLRVPPVNDMNGNEQKNYSDVLKEDSQSQQESIFQKVERSPSVSDFTQTDEHTRTEDDPIFDEDPLRIEGLPIPESAESDQAESSNLNPRQKDSDLTSLKVFDFDDDTKENKGFLSVSRVSPSVSESRSLDIWGSPVKIETPAFEIGGSPARIEAPPFPTDDSQDGLEIQPFSVKDSPDRQDDGGMDSGESSPPAWIEEEEERKEEPPETDDEDRKESVPYGTGVFEDLTPDEDEDSHDDKSVRQPMYQLPLAKKPRLLYGWHQEESASAPHHGSNITTFFPKNPARVITDNSSSLFQKSSRVYQNGPASYFSGGSSSTSVYPNSPAPAFPNSPAAIFQNSPAPRIQNSPTPIIQKSPVPIFQYSGSSRYQGSPGRRYGSSPSRRYHAVGENAGRYSSLVDGSTLQRHSGQTSASRYQTHSHSETEPPSRFRAPVDGLPATDFRVPKDAEPAHPSAQFQAKFEGRSAVRYQPLGENSATTRFQPQSENSATRLSISDDSSPVSPSVRYQSLGENSSSARFPSSTERSSLTVYPVQNVGASSQQKYFQGSSSSALSPGFPSRQPLGESSILPAHAHSQYKSLTTSDSRFQTPSDDRFQAVGGLPPSLSVQTNRTPTVATHRGDSDNKGVPQPVSRFSDAASASTAAAVFLSQTNPVQAHSSSVPKFHNKLSAVPIPQRSLSTEAAKPLAVPITAQSQQASSSFYSDHKHDLSLTQGQSASGMYRTPGQSAVVLARGQSVPGASQSQSHFAAGNVTDSDDDESDTAVPGFMPNPNTNSGQLPGHIEGDMSRPLMMKIQTQSLTKCYNSRGREIRVGDVVWGIVQGFPWWPGRVMSITITQRDHRDQDLIITQICHVSWFGSSTMSYMPSADLHPFMDDFGLRYNKKKRGPYRAAIQQALLAAQTSPTQQSNPEPLQTVNLQDLVT